MPSWDLSGALGAKLLLSGAVLGGAALCFFGCRLFKVALAVGGLICGAAAGAYLAWLYTAPDVAVEAAKTPPDILREMGQAANRTVLIVCGAAGGVGGAVLCSLLHRVGIFVLGAWLGWMLGNLTMVNAATEAYLIVVVILALIGGVLALVLRNSVVVVSTAFNGALAMMFGVYALLTRRSPGGAVQALRQFGTDAWIVLALTAVLGSIGGYVQFCTLPKQKPQVMYKKVKKQKKAD